MLTFEQFHHSAIRTSLSFCESGIRHFVQAFLFASLTIIRRYKSFFYSGQRNSTRIFMDIAKSQYNPAIFESPFC